MQSNSVYLTPRKEKLIYKYIRDNYIIFQMAALVECVPLNNGRKMPILGLGTWLLVRKKITYYYLSLTSKMSSSHHFRVIGLIPSNCLLLQYKYYTFE